MLLMRTGKLHSELRRYQKTKGTGGCGVLLEMPSERFPGQPTAKRHNRKFTATKLSQSPPPTKQTDKDLQIHTHTDLYINTHHTRARASSCAQRPFRLAHEEAVAERAIVNSEYTTAGAFFFPTATIVARSSIEAESINE